MSRCPNPCIDCRFSYADFGFKCSHEKAELAHVVLGHVHKDCFDVRAKGQVCGPDGALFETKHSQRSIFQRMKEAFTSDGF